VGTNGCALTAVDAEFLAILQKSGKRFLVSLDNNLRRAHLGAHTVSFAFFLINGKKAHVNSFAV
jgi:hypothetical protein